MPKALNNHGSRGVVCCPICQGHFLPRGFPRHSKKCERDKRMREEAHANSRQPEASESDDEAGRTYNDPSLVPLPSELQAPLETEASEHGCALPSAHVDDGPGPTATTTTISEIFRTDSDSTIDRKPAETRHSEGSASSNHPSSAQRSHFGIGEPREVQEARFCTRDDFLFAELLRESGLSREGSDRLIKLINRCIDGKGLITFSSYAELQDSRERYWKSRLTSVSPSPEIINAG